MSGTTWLSSQPIRILREPGKNIEESDGTVIFSLERRLSGGTKLTRELADKLGSRCCISMTAAKSADRTRIRFASRFKR